MTGAPFHNSCVKLIVATLYIIAAGGVSAPVFAQNTSGVSGAKVKPGEKSIGYRLAYVPETEGFAHRLHYQQAVSDRLRLRIIGNQKKTGGDLRFRSVDLEGLYQVVKDANGWNSAVELQGRIPDGNDGPGRVRIAWLNGFAPAEDWELRANIYAAREVGDRARDGMLLETRGEATYRFENGYRFGAQMFNSYNSTAAFGDFDDQKHAVGPVLKGKIGGDLKFEVSSLFGLSEAAPDATLRLFLSYSFAPK